MHRSHVAHALVAAAAISVASAAQGQIVAILSNIAGQANNTVPTIGGNFAIGTSSSTAFGRPFLSPDGTRWIINGIQEAGTDDKDLVIVGGGITAAGAATVAVEDTATSFDPSRTYSLIDDNMGINNSGHYVFTADLDGATTDDEVLVQFNGVVQSDAIREGKASPIAGENFGSTIDGAHILADGTPRYRAILTPSTTKIIAGSGASTVVAETDVTVPNGQLVLPTQSLDSIGSNQFASSFDGTKYIIVGDLNGPTTTDAIVIVNGFVVAQEGAELPGGVLPGINVGSILTGDKQGQMSPNGDNWAARMPLSDTTDIVLSNGQVKARTDVELFPGAGENWDDAQFAATFFMNTVDNGGNMVIGGLTNSSDTNKDAVLVYLGAGGNSFVLAREGDPVDLDGNGMFDDNAFIDIFGNDDGVLSPDGRFYFVAALQDANNVSIGNAFLYLNVPEPGSIAAAGLAAAFILRRRRA